MASDTTRSSWAHSSMNSSSSAESFDFMDILDDDEFQLMSPADIGILWTVDPDSDVPPFPQRPTISTMSILFDGRCMLFPRGRSRTGCEEFHVLTSIATPPRVKNLPLAPVNLDLWIDTTSIREPAPRHLAWAPSPSKEYGWLPSGSCFSPSAFKAKYESIRFSSPKSSLPPKLGSTGQRKSSTHGLNRKALVFEREITLNTDGKTKRWSLQVPATTMNPEMVDMMLELQDLNSFFKDGLDNREDLVPFRKQEEKLDPPSLVVSDSHRSIPLSVESRERQETPIPLAARRGKRPLPPLSLKAKSKKLDQYPSIPTAFLGSPSTYSPKFEYNSSQSNLPLDFGDMISSLRSQCDFSQKAGPPDFEITVDSPVSAISFAAPSDHEHSDEDDWAFAVSFIDEFGTELSPVQRESGQNLDPNAGDVDAKDLDMGRGLWSHAHAPPSIPIPPAPLAATPAQPSPLGLLTPNSVRGILKSCKNVRFASLPDKPDVTVEAAPCIPPPEVVPAIILPQRSSRLRPVSRSSKQDTENTSIAPAIVAPRSYAPTVSSKNKARTVRPVSVARSFGTPGDPFVVKRPVTGPNRSPPRPPTRHSAAPAPRKSTPVSLGRQSFGRTPKTPGDDDIDSPSLSPTRGKAGSRWTMNDMTFRRGSTSIQQNSEVTPKSRMPVPLRNILTRFK
ncbi:hypothetical protein H0H81_005087 [Sphagnurus paluster]|uniref:Uncharacterized protein n=1 Tax=Sphagnurus paluster TaxID=117069 RepID=A0A9P7FRP1_9AGAR|nr:hypothetical protein H0H81_005087 [Sphagnurus paluster]